MGEEIAKYKEISAAVSKKGAKADAKAAVQKTEAAMALTAQDNNAASAESAEAIDQKDKEFAGIVLGGANNGGIVSGGELAVDSEVYLEEPRVVAEEEEADDAEERSLWGDGDNDPA